MLEFIETITRRQKWLTLLALDTLLVPLAIFATLFFQGVAIQGTVFDFWTSGPIFSLMLLTAATSVALDIPRIRLRDFNVQSVVKAAQLTIPVTLGFLTFGTWFLPEVPFGFYVIFGNCYFMLTIGVRLAMIRALEDIYRRGYQKKRVVIYGAGNTGIRLEKALESNNQFDIVAFADDNPALQGIAIGGLPVIRPSQLPHLVTTKRVEQVILAIPTLSSTRAAMIASRFEKLGIETMTLPALAELVGDDSLIDQVIPVSADRLLERDRLSAEIQGFSGIYTEKSILVTGAGGTIGSELCRQILACSPKRLVLFEISELALYNTELEIRSFADELGIELVPVLGSVGNDRLVRQTLATYEIQVVLHAAAYKHVTMVEKNALIGLDNNVMGTATLARAAHDAQIDRLILISSDKAVRPTNVMGASKRLAELIVQDMASRSNTVFSMVRFGNVLGSSGSVVPLFRDQIARGGPVTVTDPKATRYFMTIQEASNLVLMAGSFATGGEVFVLDMGKPVEILELARRMIHASGYSVKSDENPDGDIEILKTGLRKGEKMHEELIIGEGKLTTAHEKIFSAREASLSELEVAGALKSLREAILQSDETAAVEILFQSVEGVPSDPTVLPQNG